MMGSVAALQKVQVGDLTFRVATPADEGEIWSIIRDVIGKVGSYVFYPDSSREKMLKYWLAPEKVVYVAVVNGAVVGTFTLRPNQPDFGSHIANASYMVSPNFAGKGIGKMMGEYSLTEAKRLGYEAMQFNIVIKSNEPAVSLWKSIGFRILGEVPNAYRHPLLGPTDAYIMYREL